ncbi:transglutaminase-like cysteine peptidase [Pusillimonas sp. SM2304]|uniref:transglutaminase-like cysteine peptidase n=1 Tax=Pusillimonas sp. SM2304 TaxID=3073241 RepID=UPI002875EB8E|nr:transglutaminase-like cysteine peptidase [Pusillimonas sp. SM2304]MDS1139633.1 transglutaminase-like cysteine peptidase [Pusillimonas sp. SM2304]
MIAVRVRRHLFTASTVIVLALPLAIFTPLQALQFDASRIQQSARASYGQQGAETVSRWLAMLSQQHGQPESAQLKAVNSFWNATVRGGEDAVIWKQADYWATPLETLGKRWGDCEDFVIGKYFSLVHVGVPAEKLRFIYVRARLGGLGSSQTIAHMVLGYYSSPDAEPLVLDSLTSSIVPASQRRDLTPVFSFNAQGVYVAGAAQAPVERISRWRNLLVRMEREGFRP